MSDKVDWTKYQKRLVAFNQSNSIGIIVLGKGEFSQFAIPKMMNVYLAPPKHPKSCFPILRIDRDA